MSDLFTAEGHASLHNCSITSSVTVILPPTGGYPEFASMPGGDTSSQSNRYTHNDAAFVEYNTRLQSNNLTTFSTAAAKFTEWLGSDKAYYPNARAPVRRPSVSTMYVSYYCFFCRSSPSSRYAGKKSNIPFLTTLSVIESAHVNICRVQGDPSTPFMLNKALPVFDAWHRPYLHLLRQVGSHLNYFDPELRGNPSTFDPPRYLLTVHVTQSVYSR